jgi:hypothetical protein
MEVDGDVQRWRDALQRMGKDAVRAELQRRSGSPDDLMYDIVYTPPFPTRDFCWRWCAQEDNKLFSFSRHTIIILFAIAIFLGCFIRMVDSFNAPTSPKHASSPQASRVAHAGGANAGASSGQSGPSLDQSNPSIVPSSSSSAASSSSATAPSACAYITYDTSRCKTTGSQ